MIREYFGVSDNRQLPKTKSFIEFIADFEKDRNQIVRKFFTHGNKLSLITDSCVVTYRFTTNYFTVITENLLWDC